MRHERYLMLESRKDCICIDKLHLLEGTANVTQTPCRLSDYWRSVGVRA